MPRIRAVKPDFFKDEDLAEVPFWVRILFEGLWCHADKEGRLEDRPLKIKAEIFPYDKVDTEKGLFLLSEPKKHSPTHKPFIFRYTIEGENYIQIIEFNKHQSPHHTERESIIPPYNGELTVKKPLRSGYERDAHSPCSSLVSYDLTLKEWKNIREEDKKKWAAAYPACDIELCLSQMAAWLDVNPKKTKKRYGPFIVGWLSREQQRGGMTKKGREIGNRPAGNMLPEFMKDAAAEHDRLKKAGKI